jgi:diguanylate cyclase (GGDEF)-like protein
MSAADPTIDASQRAEDLRTSSAEQQVAFFENSAHVAPIGNVVAGLVGLSLLWSHVPRTPLWAWFALVLVLAALQAVAALDPERASTELPWSGVVLDTNVLAGVVWGLLPWLDIGAFGSDEVYRWLCLALAFGIGAGSMGGLSILTGLSIRVQAPLYLLVATALLVVGQPAVAAGVVVFLVLMTSDLLATGRHLRQLVDVRVEIAELAADAESEARHDPMTGLLNRAGAFERIERLRGGDPFVMMFVDLDYFKEVNDRLGHEAGDHVLVETARRIEHAMRPGDIVARLGGDEFLVVFANDGVDVDVVTDRVLAAVDRPVAFGDDEANISASIGVKVVHEDDWSTSALLREADHALYEAKRMGRQRVVRFDEQLAVELEQRTTLEGELRGVGQPVVEMATGRIASVEITPCWSSRAGEAVPAPRLLAMAEEIGLGDALTRSIVEKAARARLQWREHPVLASASVTVRVAAGRLVRGDLVGDISSIVVAHDIQPGGLQLILTETVAIRDPLAAVESIGALRTAGVGIVLGEFGSGQSSLRDLLALPIDIVALHPGLVREAPDNNRLTTMLAALDHGARSLGLSLAAEGVDNAAQLEVVRRLGLPYAQGEAVFPLGSLTDLAAGTSPLTIV